LASLAPQTKWLRAVASGGVSGVDRQERLDGVTENVLRGYVVAQEGPFKSEGRGEFDRKGLEAIVRLMNREPNGLKSRFAHPTLSEDGIGKFLGRARNARLMGDRVRADLHLDPTSFNTPSGDLGGYVMRLAESDPAAFASSLVLKAKEIFRLDERGRRRRGDDGEELPPLWYATELHASDVVDTGDAVDSFLVGDRLPDQAVRIGSRVLDQQFPNADRQTIKARLDAWIEKYLTGRFGAQDAMGRDDLRRRRQRLRRLRLHQFQTAQAVREEAERPRFLPYVVSGEIPFWSYAAVDDGQELLVPGAFRRALQIGLPTRVLLNHNPKLTVSRWRQGLEVWADQRALQFEFPPFDNVAGRQLIADLQAGRLSGVSFNGREWDRRPRSRGVFHIRECDLLELSIVNRPCYRQSRVWLRRVPRQTAAA